MISPGRIFYQLYYKPLGAVSKTFQRGFKRTAQQRFGESKMKQASGSLREILYEQEQCFTVYFLTGKKYWYQTAFCLYSFQKVAGTNIHAVLVDDGSFDDELEKAVKYQFPSTTTVVRKNELNGFLDERLPVHTFPALRQRRLEYPHLRKLTDVHVLPGQAIKLVLDSDMLFFHRPVELLTWLSNPKDMLFLRDVSESYGYSKENMCRLTGTDSLPERVNVGVAGIASSAIDWRLVERWTDTMLKTEGSSYLQEQALTAMIASSHSCKFLNEEMYKVMPLIKETGVPEVLHHYVADSKYDYFVKGWQLVLKNT
ncbi:MAG: glycosyl transferase [Chitinophagaceae bacterium]|nr:MAG: glycosyl transferase [Chitinophagaceae bacterium]